MIDILTDTATYMGSQWGILPGNREYCQQRIKGILWKRNNRRIEAQKNSYSNN